MFRGIGGFIAILKFFMFYITLKRIIKSGYLNFHRNVWLSSATIVVMSLALFVLGNLIFLGAIAATLLTTLESKIDISVYFVQSAAEDKIFAIKREVEGLPNVVGITYVSKDEALSRFREKHKDNILISDALVELGENPLEASINIRAKDPTQYAAISDFLLQKNYSIVDKINYFENQLVIDRLGAILNTTRGAGALLALILTFVAILVAFNTIRIVIYTMREEIGIMRLVGATNWFIRGPFLVSGVIYGVISAFVTTMIFFPLTWVLAPKLEFLIPNFNIFYYFTSNLLEFGLLIVFSGIIIGVFSSTIAVRKYLKQ